MAPGVTLPARGATSPSFIIFAILVVAGVCALAATWGWRLFTPDPYALSERLVREFRREMGKTVRTFQSRVDALERQAKRGDREAAAALAAQRVEMLRTIDEMVEEAHARVVDLELAARTEKNRLDRIERRAEETRQTITAIAAEAEQKLSGG